MRHFSPKKLMPSETQIKVGVAVAATAVISIILTVLAFVFWRPDPSPPPVAAPPPPPKFGEAGWAPYKEHQLVTVEHDGHWFWVMPRGYQSGGHFIHHLECPKCKPIDLTLPELPAEPVEGPNIFHVEPPKKKGKR